MDSFMKIITISTLYLYCLFLSVSCNSESTSVESTSVEATSVKATSTESESNIPAPKTSFEYGVNNKALQIPESRHLSWFNTSCDFYKYEAKMKPIWEIFLKDPSSPEAVNKFVSLFNEYKNNLGSKKEDLKFWSDICFSRSLEVCSNSPGTENTCQCMDESILTIHGNNPPKFSQIFKEGQCGVKAPGWCKPWIYYNKNYNPDPSDPVSNFKLDCELSAGCNNKGICECAVLHVCKSSTLKSRIVLIYVSMMLCLKVL